MQGLASIRMPFLLISFFYRVVSPTCWPDCVRGWSHANARVRLKKMLPLARDIYTKPFNAGTTKLFAKSLRFFQIQSDWVSPQTKPITAKPQKP